MKSIEKQYNELGHDEELFFQAKTKSDLISILKQMDNYFDRFDKFDNDFDRVTLKDTWFILGNWRGGMFELKIFSHDGWDDYEIHILADYKESPIQFNTHLEQIEGLISIMDKNKNKLIKKRVMFNDNFHIVKRG